MAAMTTLSLATTCTRESFKNCEHRLLHYLLPRDILSQLENYFHSAITCTIFFGFMFTGALLQPYQVEVGKIASKTCCVLFSSRIQPFALMVSFVFGTTHICNSHTNHQYIVVVGVMAWF